MWLKRFLLALLILIGLWLSWNTDSREILLEQQLLCPVCSGQSVFESQHPIAQQISSLITFWKEQGWGYERIKQELHEIYGEQVSPLELPWAPYLLYSSLFAIGGFYAWRQRRS